MFVARDTIGLFLAVQVVIVLLGFFVRACDTNGAIRDLFPTSGLWSVVLDLSFCVMIIERFWLLL
jgi:hypothetical protein